MFKKYYSSYSQNKIIPVWIEYEDDYLWSFKIDGEIYHIPKSNDEFDDEHIHQTRDDAIHHLFERM